MSTIHKFEDIQAWQEGRKLLGQIYEVVELKPFSTDFELKNQIKRASISILANIAEGFGRGGNKEFLYFLSIAGGSAREVQSLLYVALDQEYLNKDTFKELYDKSELVANKIGAFSKYLRSTPIKGIRYKA